MLALIIVVVANPVPIPVPPIWAGELLVSKAMVSAVNAITPVDRREDPEFSVNVPFNAFTVKFPVPVLTEAPELTITPPTPAPAELPMRVILEPPDVVTAPLTVMFPVAEKMVEAGSVNVPKVTFPFSVTFSMPGVGITPLLTEPIAAMWLKLVIAPAITVPANPSTLLLVSVTLGLLAPNRSVSLLFPFKVVKLVKFTLFWVVVFSNVLVALNVFATVQMKGPVPAKLLLRVPVPLLATLSVAILLNCVITPDVIVPANPLALSLVRVTTEFILPKIKLSLFLPLMVVK